MKANQFSFGDEPSAPTEYKVIHCIVDHLEAALNEWAAKGYFTASGPQVYLAPLLADGVPEPFVVQVLHYDEYRWKLEGGVPVKGKAK